MRKERRLNPKKISKKTNNALFENKEAMLNYLEKLRELMAASNDETAIQSIKDYPDLKQKYLN